MDPLYEDEQRPEDQLVEESGQIAQAYGQYGDTPTTDPATLSTESTPSEGDLEPITAEEQARQQTNIVGNTLNKIFPGREDRAAKNKVVFDELQQVRALPRGSEERAEAQNAWRLKHYGVTEEEYQHNLRTKGGFYPGSNDALGNLQNTFQGLMVPGMGLADWGMDVIGNVPGLGWIDDEWDKRTQFKNPAFQTARKIGSVVVPTMLFSGAYLKSQAAVGASRIRQGAALLGIDTAVLGASDMTDEPTVLQTFAETWPKTFGKGGTLPVPDAFILNDDTNRYTRKLIHMLENGPWALAGNALGYVAARGKPVMKWFIPKDKKAINYKNLEIAKRADNKIHVRISEIDQALATKPNRTDAKILRDEKAKLQNELTTVTGGETYVNKRERSKEIQSEAAGASKAVDGEEGFDPDITPGIVDGTKYSSIPEGNIAKNAYDTSMIKLVGGEADALPTPILTENTRRKALRVSGKDSPVRATTLDIEMQASQMGDFSILENNIKLGISEMNKAAEEIFISIMAADPKNVKPIFDNERVYQKIGEQIIPYLNENAARAALWTIREIHDRIIGAPIMRTSGRIMDTSGREVAATAQAIREAGDAIDYESVMDSLLYKLMYISTEYGINQKVASAQLKLKQLAAETGPGFSNAAETLDGILTEFKRSENAIHAKAIRWTKELKRVSQENPLALEPLIRVFEHTNGDIDTLIKLQKYMENKVTPMGYLKSPTPGEMNLFAKGTWGVAFNNMLSGLAPINALKGASTMLTLKPLTSFTGAAMMVPFRKGDFSAIKRAIYYYSGGWETMRRALRDGYQIMKKVNNDPDAMASAIRKDFIVKDDKAFDLVKKYNDVWELEGDWLRSFQWKTAEMLRNMYKMKAFRTGTTGMAFVDGATDTFMETWLRRVRAYDNVFTDSGGVVTKEALEKAEKLVHAGSFDENRVIKDEALKAFSGEIKFTVDDKLSANIDRVTRSYPILKNIWTFTRARSNAMKNALSWGVLGDIPGLTKYGDTIWARTDEEKIAAMVRHGIPANDPNILAIHEAMQDEYVGRLGVSIGTVASLYGIAMSGAIHGAGHYNQSRRNREMKYFGHRPFTMDLGFGRFSYEHWPMKFMIAAIGDLGYYANDIDQPLLEDWFRKLAWLFNAALLGENPIAGTGEVFDLAGGNWEQLARYTSNKAFSSFAPWSGAQVALDNMIYDGFKDVQGELIDYIKMKSPVTSWDVPNERDIITGGYLGYSNPWQSFVNGATGLGMALDGQEPWRQWLIRLNWKGMKMLSKSPDGTVEFDNESRQWIANWIADNDPMLPVILKAYKSKKFRHVEGVVRAFYANGGEPDDLEFREELLPVYRYLNKALRDRLERAVHAYYLSPEGRDYLSHANHQKLKNELIKQGRVEEAVDIKFKKDTQNLLQMRK